MCCLDILQIAADMDKQLEEREKQMRRVYYYYLISNDIDSVPVTKSKKEKIIQKKEMPFDTRRHICLDILQDAAIMDKELEEREKQIRAYLRIVQSSDEVNSVDTQPSMVSVMNPENIDLFSGQFR